MIQTDMWIDRRIDRRIEGQKETEGYRRRGFYDAAGIAAIAVPAPPEPGGDGLVAAIGTSALIGHVPSERPHHLKVAGVLHSAAEFSHGNGERLAFASFIAVAWRLAEIPVVEQPKFRARIFYNCRL